MMNTADDSGHWRTAAFRQNVVQKIEEAILKSGTPTNKSSVEMENHVFMKAKTKDEYLGYVARLILHVREMNANKKDPMNALRAMAQPAATNQMMNVSQQGGPQQFNTASNLLQTLNQGRPNLQNRMPGMQASVLNQMGGSLGPMQQNPMHGGPMTQVNVAMSNQMNSNVNPSVANVSIPGAPQLMNTNTISGPMTGGASISNQIGVPGQIGNSMSGSLPVPMGNVINPQMAGQVQSQMTGAISHSHMNVQTQMNHMAAQRKIVPDGMMIPNQSNVSYIQPRCAVPNQFIRQNTPPPNQSTLQLNSSSSMIPSPALVPSPSPTQLPAAGGLVGPVIRQAGPNMASSPSSNVTLNTPGGQSQPTPSPLGNEEQAYRDKVKQLSRYVEPLRRMISRLGSRDHERTGKMEKLLEILSSNSQRITMEALLKCETVLEKLDIKTVPPTEVKEQHPLIEAISTALKNPNPNHTFQRTFEPVMAMLNGKPLKSLPRPLKRKYTEEALSDIPEVLQGEVARLDQRFKVSLDPVQQNSSKCIYLLCWLDDRHLPCIPPVQITIPEDYPNSSPKCDMSNYEYGATKFLEMIQKALQSRISKLPSRYTMSQLLDTWENSVRETCSSERISDSLFLVS